MRELIGPWPVSHPSRAVARQALQDSAWQATTCRQLAMNSQRLAELLAPLGEVTRTALFCTVDTADVAALFEHFARRAILTRHFDQHALLRFGLPGNETEWQRLGAAIAEWTAPC
jgi:cobalamin biosynthetic protein CobC